MSVQRSRSLGISCLLLLSCLLCLPATVWAQAATGTIAGVVKDTSGAVLPGVTIEAASPALIEKVRTVVSDEQGNYRIVDLRPGTYTVTFTLAGFSAVKREGIELTSSFTANVNADLKVGGIEETITVSGQTPVVDIANARQQTTVGRATLDAIPTTKRLGQYATFIPGATYSNPTFQDVGGTAGEGGRFSIHGQQANDQNTNVEGLNHNLFGNDVYSFNSQMVQEVVVETGATSAEATTGGVQINIVPKDGGNSFTGGYTGSWSGPSVQSSNFDDTLKARGLTASPSIKKAVDNGGSVGGPIMKDKLWFFTAHRFWTSSKYIQGSWYNKAQGTLFYQPDTDRPAYTNFFYNDDNLRLTWQANPKNKVAAYFGYQSGCNCPFGLSGAGGANALKAAPESRVQHHFIPEYLSMLTWSSPVSNKLLLESAFSMQVVNEHSDPMPGNGPNDISVTDVGLNIVYGSPANNNTFNGAFQRRFITAYNSRFAASYVTGSHSFKSGFQMKNYYLGREGRYNDINAIHGGYSYTFRNQLPTSVTIWAIPFEVLENTRNLGFYGQDMWTMKKLTLNLGVRYDTLFGAVPAHHLPAGIFVSARDFPAVDNIPNFNNVNPRVSATYDLFGNGKTAIKGSIGRYTPTELATSNNPQTNQAASTSRNWTDSNGNFTPDCDLNNSQPNGECARWSDLTFNTLRAGTRWADDAISGFNQQFNNWQASASLQQELRPGMALNVGYFRTWFGNFHVTKNLAVTPDSYDTFCITLPTTDARLPNAGQQQCGYVDIKPAFFGQTDNLRTLASNYGSMSQVYNGVDVTLTARFGKGGQFSGGVSIGRTVTDACDIVKKVPEALFGTNAVTTNGTDSGPGLLTNGVAASWSTVQFCQITPPWLAATQGKFLVVYPLPLDFQFSAIYQNIAGIPVTATYAAPNAAISPSLGRNLGSCGAAATCTASLNLELVQPGTTYEDRLQQVDLRFSRRFKVGMFTIRGSVDLSNIFNASNVYATNTGFSTVNSQWLVPYEVMGGRLMRFSGQIEF